MPCSFIIDDYEVSILKEIAGILDESLVYEPQIFQLLDEILMNCKFSNITKVDPHLINKINDFVPYVYKNMMIRSYEEKDRCMVLKAELDLDMMKKICTQNQKVSNLEGFRYFKFLYSKLLNFLRLLSNSKAYFKELVMQNKILTVLLESLNFDDTFISSQASQMLASLISFSNMPSAKIEKTNKERLLSPRLDLIGHIKRLLQKCDLRLEKNPKDLKVLEINGAFLLLFLFIKDGVSNQYDYVNSFDKFIADAIFGEDKAIFHYLDKLALRGLFSVSFGATILLNRALQYYQRSPIEEDRIKEEHCKDYVLNHSVQFIWNIYMLMRCSFEEQVEESLSFVSNVLYKNKQAVKLISRMFQKSLFQKVGKADELFKSYSWTRFEWQEFFEKLKKNYNTSTEQWNKQTRTELYDCIIQEIDDYLFFQKEYKNNTGKNKLIHPCLKYDRFGNIITTEDNIKWNNEEFEVEYPSLKNLFKVSKYFLSVLLNEKPVVPYLIEVITSPIAFWNELNTRFH